MKYFITTVFSLFTIASVSKAATINYAAQNGERNYLALADGVTFVPDNTLVRIGYFDSDLVLTSLTGRSDLGQQDVQSLEGSFREIDFTKSPGGSLRPGSFADIGNVVDPDGAAGGPNLVGKQLWILAYFYSGQTATSTVAETISNVQQFGAFALDALNWKIPSDQPVIQSINVDLGQLNGATSGTPGKTTELLGAARIPVGRYSGINELNAQAARSFVLETVPEPTSVVLLATGSLIFMLRGRRNCAGL